MTKRVRCSYQLSFYLNGDALDPAELTALLCVEATKSHKKGMKWTTSTQKEVVQKTGLWALVLKGGDREDLSTLVSRMAVALARRRSSLDRLPRVQDAYLDVLILTDADEDGGGCDFTLSLHTVEEMKAIGLPVNITFAVVVP